VINLWDFEAIDWDDEADDNGNWRIAWRAA
jgi:hypothetical protein